MNYQHDFFRPYYTEYMLRDLSTEVGSCSYVDIVGASLGGGAGPY